MKSETKVVLCLLAILGLLEAGMRVVETRLSKDLAHMRGLPAAADRLREAKSRGEKTLLVVGNSLARSGIDREQLGRSLAASGHPEAVTLMVPDGSGVAEWAYGYRQFFGGGGRGPDRVLVVTGSRHLVDAPRLELERLAAFFLSPADLATFVREEKLGVEQASALLLARSSVLFASRSRLQPLVFYTLIPGYEQAAQAINRGVTGAAVAGGAFADEGGTVEEVLRNRPAHRFTLLLDAIDGSGARPLVLAMPLPEPYSLPPSVKAQIDGRRIPVLDISSGEGFPDERFPDGYHLDGEGARLVTERLAAFLSGPASTP